MNNEKSRYRKVLELRVDTQSVLVKVADCLKSGDQAGARVWAPKLDQALNAERQAITAWLKAEIGSSGKTISSSEFHALSPKQRLAFSKDGGQIRD